MKKIHTSCLAVLFVISLNFLSTTIYGQCAPDVTPPIITCPGNVISDNDPGSCDATVTYSLPTATDNCDAPGDIVISQTSGLSSGSVFPVGTTNNTFKAKDLAGNSSFCTFQVIVNDNEEPVISNCPTDIIVSNDFGDCGADVSWTAPTAGDNCILSTFVSNYNPGDFFTVGTTQVWYIATDFFGNDDTCFFDITVNDTENPQITCPSPITQSNDPGLCGATVTYTYPTGSDNCMGSTIVQTDATGLSSGSFFPIGVITLQYTITDASLNSVFCEFTVTVNDTELPTIICPTDISVSASPGLCNQNVFVPAPTGTGDNCGVQSLVNNYNGTNDASDNYPVGQTLVTWTITDIYNNIKTCQMTVEVTDDELPTITCPADIGVTALPGACNANITVPPPTTGDNCGIFSVTNNYNGTPNASDNYPIGETLVTWTVVDVNSNKDSCIMKITVTDNEDPVISDCPADIQVNVIPATCAADVSWSPPTAADNCGAPNFVSTHNPGDNFPVGTTVVTYTATDAEGNFSICSFDVTVVDNEDPMITCPADINDDVISGTCQQFITFTPPVGTDNCPGAVTTQIAGYGSGSFFPAGTTINTFRVVDGAGNTDKCTFLVTIDDNEAPVIYDCPGNITDNVVTGTCGKNISWTPPTADDNCNLQSFTGNYDPGDYFTAGITTVTYTAVDVSNNTTTCSFTITINDNEDPTIICPADITINTDLGVCTAYVDVPKPIKDDNCEVDTIWNDFNWTNDASDYYNLGTTPVFWTVTDVWGNSATCSMNITVEDNEVPTITCPADIEVSNDVGLCSAVVTVPVPVNGDNCGVQSIINSFNGTGNASGTYPVGTTQVDWSIIDLNGNLNGCTMFVTVNDVDYPTITNCPAGINVPAENGLCSAQVSWTPPTAADNCAIMSFTSTHNPNDIFIVGNQTVTYTAIDGAGQSTTCSFNVTVFDNQPPAITCPANITQNTDLGVCTAYVDVPVPVTDDNCAVASLVNNFNGTNDATGNYNLGTTQVDWTVTDVWGNTAICSMTVTISDNEPPNIYCPVLPITVNNDPGQCNAYVTITTPGYDDNCGVSSPPVNDYNFTSNASGIYPVGPNTVTWSIIDDNGNPNSCEMTVIVVDNEDPVITGCPILPVEVPNEAGTCVAHPSWTEPQATDNCGINEWTSTHIPGQEFPVGTTLVTYTAKDDAGNIATCSFNVIVNDVEPPVVANCPVNITLNNLADECYAIATWPEPIITDNCTTYVSSTHEPGTQFPIGTTTVTYTAVDDGGNTAICEFTVSVYDVQFPDITCPAGITISNGTDSCGATVYYPYPEGYDNCPGWSIYQTDGTGLSSGSVFPVGTTTLTYEIADASLNTVTCSFSVTVEDNQAPEIICPSDIEVNNAYNQCGATVNYVYPYYYDNCPGITIYQTDGTGFSSGSFFPLGVTTQEYTAVDAAGNSSFCTFTVTVNDNEAPVISGCPGNISAGTDPDVCGAVVTWTPPTVWDNCTTVTMTSTDNPGDFFSEGTTTVTYTAIDGTGNNSVCQFTVTVNDNQSPEVYCPENISTNTDPGVCYATVTYTINTWDNCPGESWWLLSGIPSGGQFPVGTTQNWIMVTDANGMSGMCGFTVEVEDIEPPQTENCPGNIITINDPGECGAIVGWTEPEFMDNCSLAYVYNNWDPGDFFPVGTTTVWYIPEDIYGNSSYDCSFTVSVIDIELPVIHDCPPDPNPIIVNNDPGQCNAQVWWDEPWAEDNCDGGEILPGPASDFAAVGVTMTSTHDPGDFFDVGTTEVTYTAIDEYGNTTTCVFQVIVNDVEEPAISCPGDIIGYADMGTCSTIITYNYPTGSDNCTGYTINQVGGLSSGSQFPVGTTTNTFTMYDLGGNTATCNFDVTVVDDQLPTITCPEDITVYADAGCTSVVTYNILYDDNCPGAYLVQNQGQASGAAFPIGTTTNTFTVYDLSGNTIDYATCSFTVTVLDDIPPTIDCPPDIEVNNDPGKCTAIVTFEAPEGTDNCPGASTMQVSGFTSGTAFPVGTTFNTFVVTDLAGNTAECSFIVTVNDIAFPVISNCPADILVYCDGGSCGTNVNWTSPTADDNCAVISFTSNYDPGDFFDAGVHIVTYTAVDGAGNISNCSFIVTVIDDVDPGITCPADITVDNDVAACGAVVEYIILTDDNCPGLTLTQTAGLASGSLFPVGITANTFIVTDAFENTATCSFDVTVNDIELPVITCQADITESNDYGLCSAEVEFIPPVGNDNCPGAVTVQTAGLASGSVFPVGTTINTFEVTDASGNSAICSFNIIVEDDQSPYIECPDDITVSECNSTVTYTAPVGTDNCLNPVTTQIAGLASGSTFPLGTTTNTFEVVDGAGNTFSCSFDVIVELNPAPDLGEDFSTCEGDEVILDAGIAESYAWSTGASTQTIIVTGTGTYSVTVTDADGCTAIDGIDITFDENPAVEVATTNTGCGASDGTATATASGGTGTYTYIWNTVPVQTTQTASGLGQGVYYVTVDDGRCTVVGMGIVNEDGAPVVIVDPTDATICVGESVTINASGADSYAWAPAAGLNTTTGPTVIATPDVTTVYTVTGTSSNCSSNSLSTITVNLLPVVDLGGNAAICAGDNLELDAGEGFTDYIWSTNETTQVITVSTADTYSVTVTDVNGCSESDAMTLTVNSLPTVELNDAAICDGGTVVLDAGAGFSEYLWSTDEGTQQITVSAADSYSVIVTDANGCTATDEMTLTVNPLPSVELNDDAICEGSTLDLDAGAGFISYIWSNDETTQIITVSASGAYSVTVTDENGCSATDEMTLTVNTLPTIELGNDISLCQGEAATLDAGEGFASYLWSNGNTNQTINVTTANTYSVTVTDANGCTGTDAVGVTVNPLPTVDLGDDVEFCEGGSYTIDAGAGFSEYIWNTSETTQQITVNTTNTYVVTVTDENGCADVDGINVNVLPNPVVDLGEDANVCEGETLTLDAGSGFVTYLWSNDATTQQITISDAGTYSVTVTDDDDCEGSGEIIVTIVSLPVVNLGDDADICYGDTYTIDAGEGFASYIWSTGGTDQTLDVTEDGTYSVEVFDEYGCSGTDEIMITVNALPTVVLDDDAAICEGETYILDAGEGFASYIWSNDATGQVIEVAVAGIYSVTVTDDNGCEASDDFELTVNEIPVVQVYITEAGCGIADGAATVQATGGSGTYTYEWSTDPVQTNATATGLAAGVYYVTVDDGVCPVVEEVIINEEGAPVVIVTPVEAEICIGGSVELIASGADTYVWEPADGLDDATEDTVTATPDETTLYTVTGTTDGCSSFATVNVTVHPLPVVDLGGDAEICEGEVLTLDAGGFDEYIWSTGNTDQTIDISGAGTYSVTVTDENGCIGEGTMTLVVNPLPLVDLGEDTEICDDEPLFLDAGEGFASYIWSTGNTDQVIEVTGTDDYSVTVTDENGCAGEGAISVTVHETPTVEVFTTDATCGGTDGTATVLATGGSGTYTYEWSTDPVQTNTTASGLAAGVYSVTVDDGFCPVIGQAIINEDGAPDVTVTPDYAEICAGGSVELIASGADTYLWEPADGLDDATEDTVNASPDVTTNYTVTGTTDGCSAFAVTTVVVNPLPVVDLGDDAGICEGDVLTLDAGDYAEFVWSTGGTDQTLDVTQEGTYSVTVTDENGCAGVDTIDISINPLPVVDLGDDADICDDEILTLDAGEGFAEYLWSTGDTDQTLDVTVTGDYIVIVTDENGCTDADTASVTVHETPVIDVSATDATCGEEDGTATVVATGGSGTYTYEWSTNPVQTDATATGLAAGVYSVTVNDGFCPVVGDAIINEAGAPVITVTPEDTAICEGGSVQLIATGADTYLWEPPDGLDDATEDTVNATPDVTTTYTVTGTTDGCSSFALVTVVVNPLPVVDLGEDAALCEGDELELDAGVFNEYVWSTGDTDQIIIVDTAGEYSVIVTDENGCEGVGTINVTVNPLPVVDLGDDVEVCDDVIVALDAGEGYADYIWSTGDTIQIIVVDTTGEYIVVVTDTNGCESTDTVSVTIHETAVIEVTTTLATCGEEDGTATVVATGGSGAYTYEWNTVPVQTDATATGLGTGLYSVTVDDGLCPVVGQAIVEEDGAPDVTVIPVDTTICEGSSVQLIASGADTYLWDPAEGIDDPTNDTVIASPDVTTTYTVTGTTAGCSGLAIVTITVVPLPFVDLGPDTIITLQPDTIILDAGEFDSYVWQDGSTESTFDVSDIGWYSVTVTDEYGCTAEDSIYIDMPDVIDPMSELSSNISVYPNPNKGVFNLVIYNSYKGDVTIEMISVTGQMIFRKDLKNITEHKEVINVTTYPKGVYFMRISTEHETKLEKVIVQ